TLLREQLELSVLRPLHGVLHGSSKEPGSAETLATSRFSSCRQMSQPHAVEFPRLPSPQEAQSLCPSKPRAKRALVHSAARRAERAALASFEQRAPARFAECSHGTHRPRGTRYRPRARHPTASASDQLDSPSWASSGSWRRASSSRS